MFKNILLAVDLQHEADFGHLADVATELARSYGAHLHVLTVVPEFGFPLVGQYFPEHSEEKLVEQVDTALHAKVKEKFPADIHVRSIVAQGGIYHTVIDWAERLAVDLIVVAAHRPELKDYLLGPNAARIVRHGDCSVLVVRD